MSFMKSDYIRLPISTLFDEDFPFTDTDVCKILNISKSKLAGLENSTQLVGFVDLCFNGNPETTFWNHWNILQLAIAMNMDNSALIAIAKNKVIIDEILDGFALCCDIAEEKQDGFDLNNFTIFLADTLCYYEVSSNIRAFADQIASKIVEIFVELQPSICKRVIELEEIEFCSIGTLLPEKKSIW